MEAARSFGLTMCIACKHRSTMHHNFAVCVKDGDLGTDERRYYHLSCFTRGPQGLRVAPSGSCMYVSLHAKFFDPDSGASGVGI